MDDSLKSIAEDIRPMFKGTSATHDWEHTKRVYNLCMHIGMTEKADMEVLGISALLHDIARAKEDEQKGAICHAEEGSRMAEKILRKKDFNDDFISKVKNCIESHRFRNNKIPESLEAKILFDSDKLDSIGAIGIARAIYFSGEYGAKLHDKNVNTDKSAAYSEDDTAYREFTVKLRHLKDKMMTKEGKRLAEERHEFMEQFFRRLNEEIEGRI